VLSFATSAPEPKVWLQYWEPLLAATGGGVTAVVLGEALASLVGATKSPWVIE
jgi:hypothetical protein